MNLLLLYAWHLQCVTTVDVGGSVTAMLLSGGFLFVAINKLEEGIIKVYNLASGQNHQLPGHKVRDTGALGAGAQAGRLVDLKQRCRCTAQHVGSRRWHTQACGNSKGPCCCP